MCERLRFVVLAVLVGAALVHAEGAAADPSTGPGESRFAIATTAEAEMCLGLAFDGGNYLVALQGDGNDHDAVGAQFVSQAGGLVGGLIPTGHLGGAPNLGWNGSDYLIVWEDCGDPCTNELWGATISPAGVVGTPFLISASYEETGGLAWGGSNYLVVYTVATNPPTEDSMVFGRLVSAAGAVGPQIPISTGLGDHGLNNVAFDGTRFFVVWVDETNDTEIRGRFVSTAGVPGTEISIDASPAASDAPVTVFYDRGQYFVVWSDEAVANNADLYGQRVDTAGNKVGTAVAISTAPRGQIGPFVARSGGGFMVTWTDLRNDANNDLVCDPGEGTCLDLYGQIVDRYGVLSGGEIPISTDADNQWISTVERGDAGGYLVAWVDGGTPFDIGGDVYGILTPDPFIFEDGFEDGTLLAWSNTVP